MWQRYDDIISKLNTDFSATNLSEFIVPFGIYESEVIPVEERFDHLVFLNSSTDEVYGAIERKLIQQIKSAFVFPARNKTVARGNISCRIVGISLDDSHSDLYNAVLFMKVIIKAMDGWPIFVIKMSDGIHIGMRTYERDVIRNCTLCDSCDTEEVLYELLWTDFEGDFLSYYSALFEAIRPQNTLMPDYDENAIRRRGVKYDYIDALEKIAKDYQTNMRFAIEQYKESFSDSIDKYNHSFYYSLEDTIEELHSVKSSKVNTLEMLFDAEEIERIARENEQRYIQTISSDSEGLTVDMRTSDLIGKDPEEMIKVLKERKGIM